MAQSGQTMWPRCHYSLLLLGLFFIVPTYSLRIDSLFGPIHSDRHLAERMTDYQVLQGDTGFAIAEKLGISFGTLETANPGVDWTSLQADQVLQIPQPGSSYPGGTYTVSSGDTAGTIAKGFGIDVSALKSANQGVDWTNLYVGEKISIPPALAMTNASASQPPSSTSTTTLTISLLSTVTSTLSGGAPSTTEQSSQSQQQPSTTLDPTISVYPISPPPSQVPQPVFSSSAQPTTQAPSTSTAAPQSSSSSSGSFDLNAGTAGNPTVLQYTGPSSNFPSQSEWQKFNLMWPAAAQEMSVHDSQEEIGYIHSAILTVSNESNIDPRAILGVIMQESHGNVYVPTTYSPPPSSVRNPGIMQTHNGVSFDANDPQGSILQMVKDGVLGTSTGMGIKGCFDQMGNIYEAFRMYNSGTVDPSDLSLGPGTSSYVSDIANRLMGASPN